MEPSPAAGYFNLVVVSPDNIMYDGRVVRLMAPGIKQEIAILPDHTPLYSQLKEGELVIYPLSGASQKLKIDGGILRVKLNSASVIVGFDVLRH